ncbi:MAG: RtcB family protein [Anaerolineae bacterium]|jgi:tRNA-splicing ligase RtcB|nr:RtcB family protein [Anaerolineae bacterium]
MSDQELHPQPLPYRVWGAEFIDAESQKQMDNAMRLPVTVAGALMPDAHVGYGLPIGGVLATENAVIPYAVGVDIACRMRLSIYEISPHVLGQQTGKFKNALTEGTRFGAGQKYTGKDQAEHEVLDDPLWETTPFLKNLLNTAYGQLGTSGSGNHFVNWGAIHFEQDAPDLDLKAGEYLALLSHSGSRGVGYQIADRYSKLAMNYHPNLDKSARHLSWLPLDWDLGREYWLSMELAGRFASANHEIIHQRVSKAAGLKPIAVVENHHNFAWKETFIDENGQAHDVIVHRKGATPAGAGVLGVIPGSMADPGYLVRGKGLNSALNSASHGAGRQYSRRKAIENITKTERDRYLKERGVTLIGAGMDESPQAYKNIDQVINAQLDLVELVAKFTPRIVIMDGSGSKSED